MGEEHKQIIEEALKETLKDLLKKILWFIIIGYITFIGVGVKIAYSLDQRQVELEHKQQMLDEKFNQHTEQTNKLLENISNYIMKDKGAGIWYETKNDIKE